MNCVSNERCDKHEQCFQNGEFTPKFVNDEYGNRSSTGSESFPKRFNNFTNETATSQEQIQELNKIFNKIERNPGQILEKGPGNQSPKTDAKLKADKVNTITRSQNGVNPKIKKRSQKGNHFAFKQFEEWTKTIQEPVRVTPVENNKLLHVDVELFKRKKIDPPRLPRQFPSIRHSARSCFRKFQKIRRILSMRANPQAANLKALIDVSLLKEKLESDDKRDPCNPVSSFVSLPSDNFCSRLLEQQNNVKRQFSHETMKLQSSNGANRFLPVKNFPQNLKVYRKVFNSLVFRREVVHFEEIELTGVVPQLTG